MKTALLAGAAALTGFFATQAFAADAPRPIVVAPKVAAPAPSPVSGYTEFYGATTNQENWGSSYNPWVGFGGASRVNWWLSPGMSLQSDFQANWQAESDGYYYGEYEVAGLIHLSHRNDRHLWGVFGGLSGTNDYSYEGWALNGLVGAEAQAYLGDFTLYGQVGWFKHIWSYDGYDTSMVFANLEGRFFLGSNTKLAANIGVASGRIEVGTSYSVTFWGAEVEHKLGMSPLTLFARYEGQTYSGYTDNTFKGGARLMLGQPSLKAQDRMGATLKVDTAPILWLKGAYP